MHHMEACRTLLMPVGKCGTHSCTAWSLHMHNLHNNRMQLTNQGRNCVANTFKQSNIILLYQCSPNSAFLLSLRLRIVVGVTTTSSTMTTSRQTTTSMCTWNNKLWYSCNAKCETCCVNPSWGSLHARMHASWRNVDLSVNRLPRRFSTSAKQVQPRREGYTL